MMRSSPNGTAICQCKTMKEAEAIQLIKGIFGAAAVHRFTPGPLSPRGVFDVMVCTGWFNYWIEVKMKDCSVSENQKQFARRIARPVIVRILERSNTVRIFSDGGAYPEELKSLRELVAERVGGIWKIEERDIAEVIG